MPIYTLYDEDGNSEEFHYSFDTYCGYYATRDDDGWMLIDGKKWKHDIAADIAPRRTTGDGIWPARSESMAIEPEQIKEAMDRDRRCGVPTDYTKDGRPILRSEKHRRDYIRLRGFSDLKSYT